MKSVFLAIVGHLLFPTCHRTVVTIVLAIYIYVYNGYKNLSTYLFYTTGFLQAQELRELLKPLQMVQLHLPGFQDFALPKHVIKKNMVSTSLNVCM